MVRLAATHEVHLVRCRRRRRGSHGRRDARLSDRRGLPERHLRVSVGRELRLHVRRATVPRAMRRRQSVLQCLLRQRHLHLWPGKSLRLSMRGTAVPRQLLGQHDVQWHLRRRAV
jgi:hypothetical protein